MKALGLVVSDKFYLYVKNANPGMGPFWPQGHNLNKLGRCPLDDATYQISKLYAL